MARRFCLALIALFILGFVAEQPVGAITISPRNPYRSFNISGINYGSMQWEQSHRSRHNAYRRGGGGVFRRR